MDNCIHFCDFFSTLKKKYVKLKIEQHCNRLRVAYIHCDTSLINNESLKTYVHPTYNTKKKSCRLTGYCFSFWGKITFFWLRVLKNYTKWCIKMVKTSNKRTFVLRNKLHLSIQHNVIWKIFGIFFVCVKNYVLI